MPLDLIQSFRNPVIAEKLAKKIREIAPKERHIKIMHVCGTHENTISRFAIRRLLPKNVELIAGPGCPVCICPAKDIDEAIFLARKKNVILTTYGDMVKTPATETSLWDARASGANVVVVYSAHDAIDLARKNPNKEVVFFSVGFETTTPGIAAEIYDGPPENFSILSSHRLVPPAVDALLSSDEIKIDGIIAPGHVSTIIGTKPYEIFPKKYNLPVSVAGFEPLDILLCVYQILNQIQENNPHVDNEYFRTVKPEGNVKAQRIMYSVFDVVDAAWRGIGVIPKTGLEVKEKYSEHNARKKFEIHLDKPSQDIAPGCSCNKIMLGQIYPNECPMFGKVCTPRKPYGPCMVSDEGTCRIWYKYGRANLSEVE
ncbi:MAG: hydrogenase formation protein HypD [Candidatus Odinarchaeota archaeon]|nr:hydrogenase formation protein HypD [Candidatus Odinarchaeota archaeon]